MVVRTREMSELPVSAQDAPHESLPRIRVLIVNYNSSVHLCRCLTALQRQTWHAFEAVVVNNSPADRGAAAAMPDDPRFTLIESPENSGFAAGNNLAATGCRAPWIATLNPDAFPEPDWLAALTAAIERYPWAAMFGSTQLMDADPSRLDGVGDGLFAAGLHWRGGYGWLREATPPDAEVFAPCAAAALYRRDAFEAAGGFDATFFCYYEDVDLAFRLRLAGGRCVQVRDAVVRHLGSGSSDGSDAFKQYHSARNRLWLFVKNMPGPLFWLLLPAHALLSALLLAWGSRRGHGGAVWRGIRDGLRGIRPVLQRRRTIQGQRHTSAATIARALCWHPSRTLRRAPDPRPLPT